MQATVTPKVVSYIKFNQSKAPPNYLKGSAMYKNRGHFHDYSKKNDDDECVDDDLANSNVNAEIVSLTDSQRSSSWRMVRNNPIAFIYKGDFNTSEKKSQQEIGRPYIKEAKNLAVKQLSVAEKFLNNTANNEVALDIYKTFFGQHMGEEKLGIWKAQIKNMLEGVNKLDTKRNIRYSSLKITLSGAFSENIAAEVDTQAFQRGEKIYMNAYTDVLKKIKKNEALGVEHLAHILIHEVSHLRLNTKDNAYIGVMKNEGYHELNSLLALLEPEKLSASKGEREETIQQRRTRGSLDAQENADSFTTATRYLAYAAKNANFYSYFVQQKKKFNHENPSLIANPRWKLD